MAYFQRKSESNNCITRGNFGLKPKKTYYFQRIFIRKHGILTVFRWAKIPNFVQCLNLIADGI